MYYCYSKPYREFVKVRTGYTLAMTLVLLLMQGTVLAQREFREYPSFEGADAAAPLPPDYQVPQEIVIGRLMYPDGGGRFRFFGGDWHEGGTSWTDDYPRGDRMLVQMLRRYTRAHVRAVEQPVNPDDGDDIYNWPIMIVGLASS